MLLSRKISNRLPIRCSIERALHNAEMLNKQPYAFPSDREIQEMAEVLLACKQQIETYKIYEKIR